MSKKRSIDDDAPKEKKPRVTAAQKREREARLTKDLVTVNFDHPTAASLSEEYEIANNGLVLLLAGGDPLTRECISERKDIKDIHKVTVLQSPFQLGTGDCWICAMPTERQLSEFEDVHGFDTYDDSNEKKEDVKGETPQEKHDRERLEHVISWLYTENKLSVYLVIERKDEADAVSSIMDGRLTNQRERGKLMGVRFVVLLETVQDERRDLRSIFVHGIIRDGVFVHRTNNVSDSVMVLMDYCDEINSGSHSRVRRGAIFKYKPEDQRRDDFLAYTISIVNGASVDMGKAVQMVYGTMKGLMDAWNACENDERRRMLLHETVYYEVTKDPKSIAPKTKIRPQRINEAMSTKIYESFCVKKIFRQ